MPPGPPGACRKLIKSILKTKRKKTGAFLPFFFFINKTKCYFFRIINIFVKCNNLIIRKIHVNLY